MYGKRVNSYKNEQKDKCRQGYQSMNNQNKHKPSSKNRQNAKGEAIAICI